MKLFSLMFLFLCSQQCFSQQNVYCYITSVRGTVLYPDNKLVKPGEKIMFRNINQLVPKDSTCFITFYHPTEGSFGNTLQKTTDKKRKSVTSYVKEIVRGHEVSISLSSRSSDCSCKSLAECIAVDPAINSKILLIDTLLLPARKDFPDTDSCFYFFQWKDQSRIRNSRLVDRDGFLVITRDGLITDGMLYPDSGSAPLTLGVCKLSEGNKRYEIVTQIQFQVVEAGTLRTYYRLLQQADPKSEKLFDRFYTDVYAFFGKPDVCGLQKLVK